MDDPKGDGNRKGRLARLHHLMDASLDAYSMAFEIFAGVAEHLPPFLEKSYNCRRLPSALGYLSPMQFEDQIPGKRSNQQPAPVRPEEPTPPFA